ncbi:hypothetical protein EON62_04730, partial [archaeon]
PPRLQAWLLLTIVLVAANWCRRSNYELFHYTHHAVWFFFVAAIIHAWSHWYYMVGGLALYAFDKLTRLVRSTSMARVVAVRTTPGYTHLEVDASVFAASGGHYAGQYAFLNIPAISVMEWHPFTISSAPQVPVTQGRQVITFDIKSMGDGTWTAAVEDWARSVTDPASLVIHLDGPYGRAARYQDAAHLVMVAGGIGITPFYSIVTDIFARKRNAAAYGDAGAIQTVRLVWGCRSVTLLQMFEPQLAALRAEFPTAFTYTVYLTHGQRMTSVKADGIDAPLLSPHEDVAASPHTNALSPSSANRPVAGRPDLTSLFASIAKTCAPQQHTMAMVCGPTAMIDDVSKLAAAHRMDFHAEEFYF